MTSFNTDKTEQENSDVNRVIVFNSSNRVQYRRVCESRKFYSTIFYVYVE